MSANNFPTFTNRLVQYPSRVQLTLVEGETDVYEVEAITGTIEEQGTMPNASFFNSIRDNTVWNIDGGGTGTTNISDARNALGTLTWQDIYPVGAVYVSTVNTNPQNIFGGGTWESLGTDKFIRIANPNDTLSSGGSDAKTLTTSTMPQHNHSASITSPGFGMVYRPQYIGDVFEADWEPNSGGGNFGVDSTSVSCSIDDTGQENPQSFDVKPAYTEIYAWKRTA